MTIPYTYLIGWSKTEKYYYGCRYATGCSPEDLWKTYFTSSKYVKEYVEQHGDPDIIQIRKIFDNKLDCKLWEDKVLLRLSASKNPKMLNKANIGSFGKCIMKPGNIPWNKGLNKNDDMRVAENGKRTGKSLQGIKRNETFKTKVSGGMKGKYRNVTNGQINKRISVDKIDKFLRDNDDYKVGVTISKETKLKISLSLKGKSKPPRTTEHIENWKKAYPKTNTNKNVPKSDTHKRKISETMKRK